MPNKSSPSGSRYTGWYNDMVNGVLELYYKGTLVRSVNATTETVPAGVTATIAGAVNFDGAVDMDAGFNLQGATPSPRVDTIAVRLGTTAAVASNGADAILPDAVFVVPSNYTNGVKIVAAHRWNISASDVTKGTATTSASYRRLNLITNTAGTGSGTDIVASLNATASLASLATRSFTTVNSAIPAGAIVMASHLTVGAATADGTDMAASVIELTYQIL